MPYTQYVTTTPAITQTRQQIVDSARNNLLALRDGVISGRAPGWTLSVSGGTAEEPAIRLWSSSTDRIRASITYTSGYPTAITWAFSSDSGANYDTICSETTTYDGSNNQTAGTNSSMLSWLWEWMGKLKALRVLYLAHVAATGTAVHGLGTISTQSAAAVALTGGNIDAVTIGATTRALGNFLQAREIHATPTFGATTTCDWATAGSFSFTASASGAATLAFTNIPASGIAGIITLDLTNGGLRTWTYPANTKWAGGVAPTLTSSGTDILMFYTRNAGTTIHASMSSKDSR